MFNTIVKYVYVKRLFDCKLYATHAQIILDRKASQDQKWCYEFATEYFDKNYIITHLKLGNNPLLDRDASQCRFVCFHNFFNNVLMTLVWNSLALVRV